MEAALPRVHSAEAQATQHNGREPWRLWVEAQCAYHDGNYLALDTRLQRLLAASAGAGAGRSGGLLEAVVPLPSLAEVSALAACVALLCWWVVGGLQGSG